MKKIKVILLFVILLSLFSCSKKAEGPNIKEGKWEITITFEAKTGMPFNIPPTTFTQCITRENKIPHKIEPNQPCKITKQETRGNTVSWIIECKTNEGPMISEGTITYKGTNFDGTIKSKSRGTEFTQTMTGKWVGECK